MTLVNIPIGRKEYIFIGKETAFGTYPDPFLTGQTVRLQKAPKILRKLERKTRMDKGANASPLGTDDFSRSTEWSIPDSYFRPSGVLGTAPEFDVLLEQLLGVKHVTNLSTTVSAGTSSTQATLTSTTGLQVGDVIGFSGGNADARGEFAVVLTLPGGNVVTWGPAISVTPSASVAVKSGITYSGTSQVTASIAFMRALQNVAFIYPGCWVDSGKFSFARDEFLLAGFAGGGMGKRVRIGASNASGGGPSASLPLTVGEGRLFDFSEGTGYISIAGAAAVKVLSGGGASDTLTLSGSNAFNNADEITPGVPARTLVGAPVTGILGRFYWMDGSTQRTLSLEKAEVQIKNNFKDTREYGNAYAYGYVRDQAFRNTTFNAIIKASRLQQLLQHLAIQGSQFGLMMQGGTASGQTAVLIGQRAKLDADPDFDVPDNGEAMQTINGLFLASGDSADDEISLGLL